MRPIFEVLAIGAFMIASGIAIAANTRSGSTSQTHAIESGTLTYEVFEYSVEHADLDVCPCDYALGDDVFCSMTFASDAAHIFVFSYDGDQPLQQVISFDLSAGILMF